MARFITINITDQTTPISQAGFGLGFILDPVADSVSEYDYTEVRALEDIPTSASQLAQDMANAYLSQTPNPGVVAMQGVFIDVIGTYTTITEALNSIIVENNDWYGLLLASREQADIEEADGWIPANKLFITQPLEADWATTLSAYTLLSDKTGVFPHTMERQYDAAIMSRMFATGPGSATWKWKQLSGVNSSGYTNANISSMLSPGVDEPYMNPMIHEMGVDYTADGRNVNGGYLDIQRAIDWMDARLTENIFQLMITADKVPYTNGGISQVVSRIKEIFQQAVTREVIAVEDGVALWTINAPRRQDVPTNIRANRILPDINFDAVVAGAIHEVEVSGVLRV